MDEPTQDLDTPRVRFGPDRRLTVLAAALALGAVALAAGTGDPGGRILWGAAAVILAGYALGDVLFWPRLTADATGVRIRSPLARHDLRWPEVEQIRADVRSRYGLRSATLEVDAGEILVVLSRRALGVDPQLAAELINSVRPDRV